MITRTAIRSHAPVACLAASIMVALGLVAAVIITDDDPIGGAGTPSQAAVEIKPDITPLEIPSSQGIQAAATVAAAASARTEAAAVEVRRPAAPTPAPPIRVTKTQAEARPAKIAVAAQQPTQRPASRPTPQSPQERTPATEARQVEQNPAPSQVTDQEIRSARENNPLFATTHPDTKKKLNIKAVENGAIRTLDGKTYRPGDSMANGEKFLMISKSADGSGMIMTNRQTIMLDN